MDLAHWIISLSFDHVYSVPRQLCFGKKNLCIAMLRFSSLAFCEEPVIFCVIGTIVYLSKLLPRTVEFRGSSMSISSLA